MLETLEDADKFSGIRIDVVREDVLVDRPARRGVNAYEAVGPHANRKIAEKFPAIGAALRIFVVLKLLPRPETGRLGATVEVERLVQHRKIVIAHQCRASLGGDQIETFHRIWPIADDVPKADDVLYPPALDFFQYNGECLQIRMNVRNDCKHTKRAEWYG